jgi:hypothetical protein
MDASRAVLEELCDDLVEWLRPLDVACLNWTPPVAATNSIAGAVRHTVGSTHDDPREHEVTMAWCVADAVIHSGEHSGQIQLNRQFYAAR